MKTLLKVTKIIAFATGAGFVSSVINILAPAAFEDRAMVIVWYIMIGAISFYIGLKDE